MAPPSQRRNQKQNKSTAAFWSNQCSASWNLYVDVLTFHKKEKSQEDIIIIIMATQVVKGYFRVAVCATVLAAVYGFPGPQGPEGPLAIPREEIAVAASGSPASALRFEVSLNKDNASIDTFKRTP